MSIEVPIGSRVSPGGAQGPQGTKGEFLPVGTILIYAGANAPESYLICDGASYSREAYPELAEVLGTAYGGDEDNFNVPDLRARVPVGIGVGDGTGVLDFSLGMKWGTATHTLSVHELASHAHTQSSHQHISPALGHAFSHWGNHTHAVPFTAYYFGAQGSGGVVGHFGMWGQAVVAHHTSADASWSVGIGLANHARWWTEAEAASTSNPATQANGGNGAHNNVQPGLGVNYIIKY